MEKEELLKSISNALFDLSLNIHEEFGGVYQEIPERYRFVIILISKYKTLYVKDLADLLHISPSSVSQMLSKMEKERYIVRELDPGKRRQTFVKLGVEGEKILRKMTETTNKIYSKYLIKLSYNDLVSFQQIAVRIKEVVESEREAAE
ncbi:MarR family winged helix-turn-helix transcriptional regulator [Alteribacillus sp. YIM 98480]|uniref:MarR family winged helix-turn-helix transcriptional regulator n=1 Tax=Alteribacillus sp. YIM 98480 TaxID=2606599 RepID=UPI00131AB89D|nr:MarR family transcriptional regulator [Alteribacillus sp. YIM 98480]